jgi:hypothetical protein
MRCACSFASCTRSGVVVSSDVAGGACRFVNRACLHFSNASLLAAVITYGLRGLPDFVNLASTTTAGVPVSMADGSVSNCICEDCGRETVSQYLTERICALVNMASKEDAFIQEHFLSAMPTSKQRTSGDVYDKKFFPDMTEEQLNNIPDEQREMILEPYPHLNK